MVDNPLWAICERVAEVQAPLDVHVPLYFSPVRD